ncbi:MAG: endonuclease [Flavobacteriales bacterium]|nr:endonuclease [Bacteroidota bacterium]MCB9241475.1 endonuclease [Flavobacteriales bacterium]
MHKLIALILGFGALSAHSQITLDKQMLDFGDVTKGTPETLSFKVTNHYPNTVRLDIGSSNNQVKVSQKVVQLNAGKSVDIEITVDPVHNINYNSEVIVQTDSRSGAHRLDIRAEGRYPDAYYSSTYNLYDEDLKAELKSIISKNYVNLGYNGARDKMYGDIDNKGGKVECVYTGRTATFNSRSGANDNSFNCEHTWPQSLFNSNEPEKADIHHLFPTDVTANGKRGNYPFGVVTSPSWEVGGSKLGSNLFEPRDEHKGDVARALFYFGIRYSNYSSFLTNQESKLREWAYQFPPDATDSLRNEKIFGYQKNRNPFVDHPEFLQRISVISSTFNAAGSSILSYSALSVDLGDYPNSDTSVYQLILTNGGNPNDKNIVFSSAYVSRNEFELSMDSFTVIQGESQILRIRLKPDQTLGLVSDTLHLISTNPALTRHIPLSGTINSLSSVGTPMEQNPMEVWGQTLRVQSQLGSHLAIFSLTGHLIRLNEISSSFTELNLSEMNPGTYFAVLNSPAGERRVLKFQLRP